MILDQFYQFCSIMIGLLCFWGLLPPICHRGEGSHQFLRRGPWLVVLGCNASLTAKVNHGGKKSSPKPGIELTNIRSRVRHAHHCATRAGPFFVGPRYRSNARALTVIVGSCATLVPEPIPEFEFTELFSQEAFQGWAHCVCSDWRFSQKPCKQIYVPWVTEMRDQGHVSKWEIHLASTKLKWNG